MRFHRPYDYPFPLSRGRTGFEMKENGEFIQYDTAPADGSRMVLGHWSIQGPNRITVRFDDPSRTPIIFEVVSCDENILVSRVLQ